MDCARTLLIDKGISQVSWREFIRSVVYTLNLVQLKKVTNMTPYELWYGHKPNVSYSKTFWCRCYIHKDERNEKFNSKGDEGIFLGYSSKRKDYKCLKKATKTINKIVNVRIDDFTNKNEEEREKIQWLNKKKLMYMRMFLV